LALFGRRPAERVVRSVLPASENLRKLRTRLPAFYVRFDRLRTWTEKWWRGARLGLARGALFFSPSGPQVEIEPLGQLRFTATSSSEWPVPGCNARVPRITLGKQQSSSHSLSTISN
jgi:hypothetical protein